ncbi:MAG: hypothetical protein VX498_07520 [Myxococcota bacterium]|nr:hypothetical protein [Myxococcota bacterium]
MLKFNGPIRIGQTPLIVLVVLILAVLPQTAEALEFRLDGYYRFRADFWDNMSLDREAENSDGVRTVLEHRLRLAPHFRLSSNVHVYADFDVMDALTFGSNPEVLAAAGALQETGQAFDEPLPLSDSVLPGSDYRESVFVRRAWAEVYTPYVDLKIGRMGNHWGMGLFANDGNGENANFGDTVDRIMVSTSALDPVRISLAVDTRAEGFINRNDDTHSFLLSGGYLGELHQIGGYVRWTRQPSNSFNLVHGDLYGATKLGPLSLQLEALILWGSALDTDIGVEDLTILAGGGALDAQLSISPIEVGLQVGLATGDSDPSDNAWHTMRFDRDHDIALILFEDPLPQHTVGEFADSSNANIDLSQAVTGNAVSNAFYFTPSFHVTPIDNLTAGVRLVAAWPVVPEAFGDHAPKFYGAEVDFDVSWLLYGNFELAGEIGIFLPGAVFGEDLDPVIGAEIRAQVHF